jgi:hypothetical protein
MLLIIRLSDATHDPTDVFDDAVAALTLRAGVSRVLVCNWYARSEASGALLALEWEF